MVNLLSNIKTEMRYQKAKQLIQKRIDVYEALLSGSNVSDAIKVVYQEFTNVLRKIEEMEKKDNAKKKD